MSKREHSFLSIPLKSQIFIPSEIGRNERIRIRFNEFFTKTLKISLYIQPFVLKYGLIIILSYNKFISSSLCYSQIRLLTFYLFSFLYFKTSNQGYLISFHSFSFISLI